jgi:D-sedoheptulose 7-phosphate isomerase
MRRREEIERQVAESIALKRALIQQADVLIAIADVWLECLRKGGKILLCGNGGSAADAQHIAAELAGKFRLVRRPLPGIALTTNTSILTAVSNDLGYETVFALQVRALARPGDVFVGISTSGNSPNVLRAVEAAKEMGATTVGLSGSGGPLKDMVDLALAVPSTDTPRIQEAHITAGHLVCGLVEQALFGGGSPAE